MMVICADPACSAETDDPVDDGWIVRYPENLGRVLRALESGETRFTGIWLCPRCVWQAG